MAEGDSAIATGPGPDLHGRFTAYLAAEGFVDDLVAELVGEFGVAPGGLLVRERLVLAPGLPHPAAWAQNVWLAPVLIPIDSIGDGAGKLKAIQRNWVLYPLRLHRRASLIEARLPKVSARPLVFGEPAPTAPLGSWTLWDEGTILASAGCASPFPHGEARFEEDKTGPPNRAYLKLWELFTLLGQRPGPGDLCVELGSSPGGWTWVLQGLGARVFSVDKAPLAPEVGRLPRVEHCLGSGFGLDPRIVGAVDWFFCDMACYPERLHAYIERWLEVGECRRFVCTLKFQGPTDFASIRRFRAIPGARLLHLFHNKHELTFARLG